MSGWPDEVRALAARAVRADSGGCLWTSPERLADYVLDAIAPFVAAREAAAFKRGLDEAAQEVDCGCDIRNAVLERLESQGHKRASYLCSRGDVCCALAAAAIRALPIPEDAAALRAMAEEAGA